MAQATPDVSRIPSGVILTKQGERHCAEHAIDAAEIAAKNNRARLSIGREIEELLRIRREADATAARLIDLLDLEEPDRDLEPSICGGHLCDDDREADESETEPDLGWNVGHQPDRAAVAAPTAERRMKPACRTVGRERQRLKDLAPTNPISEECWSRVSLPPPTTVPSSM